MKDSFEATGLDVLGFAQAAALLSGVTPLRQLERLQHEAVNDTGLTPEVTWSAQGEWRAQNGEPDQAWLHLQAQISLPLACQRCLHPVRVPLVVDRAFRFVADEATAMAQDGESEEDVLVLSRSFDLLALIEDELLMALPVLSQHESCAIPISSSSRAAREDAPEDGQRPHPFAALAQLVSKRDGSEPD